MLPPEKTPKYTHHVPPPCLEEVDVLFADEHILVVVKPAGLLSVPGRIVKDCVLQRMRAGYPDVRIVHRLDLDTSGLLVLSLSDLSTSDLNRQFREREISKQYVALVYAQMQLVKGEIDLPIRPDPDNRPRQLVDHVEGKSALTRYERLEVFDDATRVLLRPVTGRSHQLRIHLAEIHHPILGCDLYAHEAALSAAKRLCLHASQLEFTHPASGEILSFSSRVPF
jgi:tRNA pseudouridine32 synthase/23S rRNA pseudouridine746 synthase